MHRTFSQTSILIDGVYFSQDHSVSNAKSSDYQRRSRVNICHPEAVTPSHLFTDVTRFVLFSSINPHYLILNLIRRLLLQFTGVKAMYQ